MNKLLPFQNYEYFMERADYCETNGTIFECLGEEKLSRFYFNAAIGFRKKAMELKLKDA